MEPISKEIFEDLSESLEGALLFTGYDDCIVGVAGRCGMEEVFVYGYDLLVAKLMTEGMTDEEAVEWLEYNMAGSWVGEGTPLIMRNGG